MNKAELIDAIAKESGLTKADAKRALEAFISTTTRALKRGERVTLVGFGTLSIKRRAARKGRNFITGKAITISSKKTVKFNLSQILEEIIEEAKAGKLEGNGGAK